MKPHRPLAPSTLDIILACLLAAALFIPWLIGRAAETVWKEMGR